MWLGLQENKSGHREVRWENISTLKTPEKEGQRQSRVVRKKLGVDLRNVVEVTLNVGIEGAWGIQFDGCRWVPIRYRWGSDGPYRKN